MKRKFTIWMIIFVTTLLGVFCFYKSALLYKQSKGEIKSIEQARAVEKNPTMDRNGKIIGYFSYLDSVPVDSIHMTYKERLYWHLDTSPGASMGIRKADTYDKDLFVRYALKLSGKVATEKYSSEWEYGVGFVPNKAGLLRGASTLVGVCGLTLIAGPPLFAFLLLPAFLELRNGIRESCKKTFTKENIKKSRNVTMVYWEKFEKILFTISYGQRIVIGVIVSVITCIVCYTIADYCDIALFDHSEAWKTWIFLTVFLGLVWFELLKIPRNKDR